MTREQLDKLAQLLTDTAQTASTIELASARRWQGG